MDTKVKPVEVLPLVKYYMEQLGLEQLFDKFVPNSNGAEIAPAQVLSLLVMNIMVSAKPLYRVEEWLHDYLDGVTKQRVAAAKYNDDRLGRNLDLLFVADRASFLTELSAKAIVVHQLETATIHNDSTSVTFLGAYDAADPKAVKITHGYNKDHRPDCKQIVFGLNITGDGYVPLGYHLYDGNQADVTTHIPNWQHLRELLDREDFVYVADSKLCSEENLKTIADNGGRFITVVPRNFREVKDFLERVGNGEEIVWQHQHEVPDSRKQGRRQTYRIHVGETMDEGARILWVHSTAKARLEQNNREQRISKAEQAVEKVASGLNQRFLKTRDQIEAALQQATKGVGACLSVTLHEVRTTEQVQVGRGRPGPNTRYEDTEQIRYRLEWRRDETAILRAQRTDGLFPLTDNTALDPVEVLSTYKNQPYLEKRGLFRLVWVGRQPVGVATVRKPVVVAPQASRARSGASAAQCGQRGDEWGQAGGNSWHIAPEQTETLESCPRLAPTVARDIPALSTRSPLAVTIEPGFHRSGRPTPGSQGNQSGLTPCPHQTKESRKTLQYQEIRPGCRAGLSQEPTAHRGHHVPLFHRADVGQPDRTSDAPGDAGAAHREPTPAACRYADEKADLAHDHGLVSRRPSHDYRTLRQGYSGRTERAERIATADSDTAESTDHNLHKVV